MKISKELLQRIISDAEFSLELSIRLKIKQSSVEINARRALERGNKTKLLLPECLAYYRERGLTDEEIFEPETAAT